MSSRLQIYQSPVGLSGAPVANQLSEMVTLKASFCKPFCIANSNQPNATVRYEAGNPVLNGTTVFVPITVYVQITVPKKCGCGADVIPYTGYFEVAFQGRTTLPTTAPTIDSVGTQQGLACVNNGEAYGYVINDSIVVSIGAAAAAS